MAAHSSMLAWKIPWTAEPGSYLPRSCKESDMTEQLHFHFHFSRNLIQFIKFKNKIKFKK